MKNKGRALDAVMGLFLALLVTGSYIVGEPILKSV